MTITQPAIELILVIMKKNDLNPLFTYLQLERVKGACGISFVREYTTGQKLTFGALKVIVKDPELSKVSVDFGEVNGRKGLIFRELP